MVGASPPASAGRSTIVGESKGFAAPPGVSIMVGASDGGRFMSEEELPLLEGVRTAAPPSPRFGDLPFARPPSSSMGYLSPCQDRGEGKSLQTTENLCTSTTPRDEPLRESQKYITHDPLRIALKSPLLKLAGKLSWPSHEEFQVQRTCLAFIIIEDARAPTCASTAACLRCKSPVETREQGWESCARAENPAVA